MVKIFEVFVIKHLLQHTRRKNRTSHDNSSALLIPLCKRFEVHIWRDVLDVIPILYIMMTNIHNPLDTWPNQLNINSKTFYKTNYDDKDPFSFLLSKVKHTNENVFDVNGISKVRNLWKVLHIFDFKITVLSNNKIGFCIIFHPKQVTWTV